MNNSTTKAADMAAKFLTQLSNDLAQGNSDTLQHYLDVMSRFHRYSHLNTLLILFQRPDATQVAGFNKWKELGRWVRQGEKGIAILAPSNRKQTIAEEEDNDERDPTQPQLTRRPTSFITVHVFDLAQTDGEPLPDFQVTTGSVGCHLQNLQVLVRERGISLSYADSLGGAMGVSKGNAIVILKGLSPAEELSVLAHELAHELLHRGDRRIETTTQIRELEAEGVAYVVTRACGLENARASWDYIRLYGGDEKLLAQSLAYIQRAAADILDFIL